MWQAGCDSCFQGASHVGGGQRNESIITSCHQCRAIFLQVETGYAELIPRIHSGKKEPQTHIQASTCALWHAYPHPLTYTHMHTPHPHIYTHLHIHTYPHTHSLIHTYIYLYTHSRTLTLKMKLSFMTFSSKRFNMSDIFSSF